MTVHRPHTAMKDSGVEWIGPIPAHWKVLPFYSFAEEVVAPNTGMKEDNLLSLSYGNIVRKDINRLDGLTPASFEGYNIIEPNDIVFRLTDLQNDWTSLRSAMSLERGIITSAYVTVRPKSTPRFFNYLMRAYDATKVFYGIGGGIRQSMKFADLKRLPVILPDQAEREAIADHLDRETARIDNLIARKTRFIDLLAEKRQALITHTISKGLNPTAKMKDSGVEWLGGVPAHWALRDFWTVAQQISITGKPDEGLLSVYLDRGVIPYSEGGGLVHKPSESLEDYQLVEPGNFVLNNQQAWRGSVGVSKHRGIVSPAYLVFKLSPLIDPDYANYLFRTPGFADQMMLSSQGVGDIQRQIKWPHLRKVKVALPSLEEQRQIAASVNRQTARIDALISRTGHSIALLREHRTALIASAVAGKIELREAK
jgi:type I restriction enzyme, S subunit